LTFLLDTNVVSEAVKARPSTDVMAWTANQPAAAIFLSVATIAEIDFGVSRLAPGAKRSGLQAWRDALVTRTAPRILPVDLQVAQAWGVVRARAEAAGRGMSIADSLIAATAEVRGFTVVTRNVRDFEGWGGPVLNPWSAEAP
jgi:hypothetical protein